MTDTVHIVSSNCLKYIIVCIVSAAHCRIEACTDDGKFFVFYII